MKAKRFLSEPHIKESLKTFYGIDVSKLTPLQIGADINAFVYKAQTLDQKSYFVKLKHGHDHDQSAALLDFLHREGIEQIIPPIKSSQGLLTQLIENFTLIVYPYIENQNGFMQNLTDEQWVTLGSVFKKVHAYQIPISFQNWIKKEDYSPRWREKLRSIYKNIETESGHDLWVKKLIEFLKIHRKEIYRIIENADSLSQNIDGLSPDFVLCHADIHGGNVLISEEGSIYIVDWDQPILAPKERDLMFIGGGVANVWNNPHEEEFFYQGYGKTEINAYILAYYRHERIVQDIVEYAMEFLFNTQTGDKSEMYYHLNAMFVPRGVVEIAFQTAANLK